MDRTPAPTDPAPAAVGGRPASPAVGGRPASPAVDGRPVSPVPRAVGGAPAAADGAHVSPAPAAADGPHVWTAPAPPRRAQPSGAARVREDDLRGLRDKYARMRAMRAAHHAGEEDASAVRPQMAELASYFPGALREIDDLELAEIDLRLAQLDAVLRGNGRLEPWMEAIALFHRLTRGALSVKRWLNGRRVVTEEVARSFVDEHRSLQFAEDVAAWQTELGSLAVPPAGRISDLVYGRIAAILDVSEADARRLAFGRGRASRVRALPARGRQKRK